MAMRTDAPHARGQRGFSLVEVLVAMAITAVVIVSVSALFFLGRQNVYSGKQVTLAVGVATRVTEDLAHMQRSDVYSQFNLSAETLSANTVLGKTYSNSIIRTSTKAADIDPAQNDKGSYLGSWIAKMTSNFATPKITVIFMPRLATVAPATDTGPTAQSNLLQIRTVIEWDEGLRHRSLIVDTVKTQRT
jgi:prepilin-type N-terminal cleavage/methylation domain-containing protein